MAVFNKFNSFVEAVAEGTHNLGSNQLTIALSNVAPVAGNSVLADITQITYTNLSTRNLTTTSSSQTGGLYKLVVADTTLTSTGGPTGPFRYVVVYNSTAAGGPLIGWFDYGSSITLLSGESLTVDFDQTNGLLTLQ
ncbi:MAG: hypothetical protein IM551_12940 [Chitinophagaceae bacterium]|nr:hypothetical protein [Chitinophagaceae bacterium]